MFRSLTTSIFAILLLAPPCLAQQTAQPHRIGFVAPQGRSLPLFDAFREGLAKLGYIDGQNIVIVPRFAEGQYDRFPAIFEELAKEDVELVAVTGAVTARAAMRAVSDKPIVFSVVVDPVADNVVSRAERPGGNITGLTTFDPRQATKQFKLLLEAVPTVKRVAILGDQGVSEALIKAATEQARELGLEPQAIRVAGPAPDLQFAIARMKEARADALLVLEEPLLGVHAEAIAKTATENHLPTVFAPSRASAGGLLCYGVSQTEAIRHMAEYIDEIFKGTRPGDMPVRSIDKYELIINRKTAKSLGITVPPAVLNRADKVIE